LDPTLIFRASSVPDATSPLSRLPTQENAAKAAIATKAAATATIATLPIGFILSASCPFHPISGCLQ
jgi:hypothetical protein